MFLIVLGESGFPVLGDAFAGKDPFLNVDVFQLLQTGISKLWNDVLFRLIDVVLYSGRGELIFT